ncbi:hypothetical protein LSH36_156g06032 [Paralvinella palmiformis]|uniref:Uncharacterized protein n=1 Tax=Paralvinella palmiformis TaxID=53620 RepID=A0AAD9JVU6_9ANNE|nr:hypothetical protein LSH36_156g06032 [Paralvinella palmiformis]
MVSMSRSTFYGGGPFISRTLSPLEVQMASSSLEEYRNSVLEPPRTAWRPYMLRKIARGSEVN